MCRISTSPTALVPVVSPRPSAGARPSAGRRAEVDTLLRDLAYVYRLAEQVREEMLPGGGRTGAETAR
jgi:hypothetical protein